MSTLTGILLKRVFKKSNGPESNKQGRKEGEGRETKKEHSGVFVSPALQSF